MLLGGGVGFINPKTREEEKKRLCDIASSHLARRTFIGNLYKETPDPNIIGKLSGHKEGSRAFARYRDIDDDMLTDLVSKLNIVDSWTKSMGKFESLPKNRNF